MEKVIQKIIQKIKKTPLQHQLYSDMFDCIKILAETDKEKAYMYDKQLRELCVEAKHLTQDLDEIDFLENIRKETYHLESIDLFDSYLIYLEWNREANKKFYLPRRNVLKPLVQDLQDLADHKIKFLGISLPPRVGKLISDDTPVLTSEGWKQHGNLKVGDYVISPNGRWKPITHVFPKDKANIRCHFTNGTYVDVHENHEWVVYNHQKQVYETVETKEIIKNFKKMKYEIPAIKPVKGIERKLPVEAYTLGAWLGSGEPDKPTIHCAKEDLAIVERIISDGYPVAKHNDTEYEFEGLDDGLRKLNMYNTDKHIPDIYMTAPMIHRIYILAGFIDSMRNLSTENGIFKFRKSQSVICNDIASVLNTFGWQCYIYEKKDGTYIEFRALSYILCELKRNECTTHSKPDELYFSKFEKLKKAKSGNCISVSGGVYCVGRRLIPTHNSTYL